MTKAEIIERINVVYYPNPSNKIEILCHEREVEIKKHIQICFNIIQQHEEYRVNYIGKISYLKDIAIKKNLNNLSEYIELLANELAKEKLIGHCSQFDRFGFSAFHPDYIFIIFNSLYGGILSDVIWDGHMTILEAFALSVGKLDFNHFGKYIPVKIDFLKNEIIPNISKTRYKHHVDSLKEILTCYNYKLSKACNLLLLVTIEGIVRDLASFLNVKQNLNLNLNTEKFNSLYNILNEKNLKWEEDYEIEISSLEMLNYDQSPTVINYSTPFDASNLINNFGRKVKINLNTRLHFLKKRFKEDRDMILHGQIIEYGSDWHIFVNLACLSEVYATLKYYETYYN